MQSLATLIGMYRKHCLSDNLPTLCSDELAVVCSATGWLPGAEVAGLVSSAKYDARIDPLVSKL